MKKIIYLFLALALTFSFVILLSSCEEEFDIDAFLNGEYTTESEDTTELQDTTNAEDETGEEDTTEPEETSDFDTEEVTEEITEEVTEDTTEEVTEDTTEEVTEDTTEEVAEDTTEPEEITEPEDTTEPEEITEPEDTTEPEETTAPEDTEETVLYSDGVISISYPSNWIKIESDKQITIGDSKLGYYMNITVQSATDIYETLTLEMYNEYFKPYYEGLGMQVKDVSVGRLENANQIEFVTLYQVFVVDGVDVPADQAVVTFSDSTYLFTFFEMDEEIKNALFDSIAIEGYEPGAEEPEEPTEPDEPIIPDGYVEYNNGSYSIIHPEAWHVSDLLGSASMSDLETGASINVTVGYANDTYDKLTLEMYDKYFKPVYEELGLDFIEVSIERKTNAKGFEFVVINQTFDFWGVELTIDQMIATNEKYTYIFTFTNIDKDVEALIFDSISIEEQESRWNFSFR